MARPHRPVPPPLEGNDTLVTAVITVAWAVALVVLAVLHSDLPAWGTRWIWTCATGVGLGLFGLAYVPRIKRSRARAAAGREQSAQERHEHEQPGQQQEQLGQQPGQQQAGPQQSQSSQPG